MPKVIENPFGEPEVSKKTKLKKFLFAVSNEMGLYAPYNSDTMIKAYNYCKEQLGDEFEYYFKIVREHISRQEPSKEDGKVAINFLTDVFTKFPQIINQLTRAGLWHSGCPDGWSVDKYGLPCHPDYRLISQSSLGYTFVHKDVSNSLPPLLVVYNKDKKAFKRIENLKTRDIIWKESQN